MDIDDGTVNAFIAALDSRDKPAIRAAVDVLIPMASDAAPVRRLLENRLLEAGHRNYWPAAYILGHLSPVSAACIGSLIEALDHREPDIRWAMALLLVRIAKRDGAVTSRLFDLAGSGTSNQKRMALYCIRDLELSDEGSLTVLLRALRDDDPTVRVAAVISLKPRSDMDAAAKEVLLQVYLSDSDARVRHTAAVTLANVGDASAGFLEALNSATGSPDPQTRKAAAAALEILEKRRPASTAGKCDA